MASILEALSRKPFSVVGHRGAAGVKPENTLEGIEYALKIGADVVEVDVRSTKDNVLILLHDETFERLAGIPLRARDLDYSWIKKNIRLNDETIPTLDEALDLVRDNGYMFIEVKEPDVTGRVIELVEKHKLVDRVAIISFYDEALAIAKTQRPDIVVGLIYFKPPGRIFDAKRLKARIVLPYYRIASAKANRTAHKLGLKVVVWTINDGETARDMLNRGVDAIASDYPDLLVRFREEIG